MSDQPRRPRLTRDAVLAGAVSLADEIGVDPLTIRKLADHLEVKPMTIYHHVANKDEIIDGMVDAVFAEIEMPPADTPWRAAMRARAHSARAALRRHPWAAGMLDSRTNPGPANLAHHDAVIACLRTNGFSMAMIAHAYATLDAFIYGFALQEAALPGMSGDELVEQASEMMAAFTEHYPNLADFTVQHVLQPGYDFGDEFDFGLDLILDGLERAAG
jgi:AcrR family transcriptional regulator